MSPSKPAARNDFSQPLLKPLLTTMDLYDSEGNLIQVVEAKQTIWQKIGGGSLLIAAIFHAVLCSSVHSGSPRSSASPRKKLISCRRAAAAAHEELQSVAVKKRAQITPPTNVKRVFAEGATVHLFDSRTRRQLRGNVHPQLTQRRRHVRRPRWLGQSGDGIR